MTSVPGLLKTIVLGLVVANAGLVGCESTRQTPDSTTDPTLAIENVTVVPMDRERLLPDHTVLVSGSVISAVGPSDSIEVPPEVVRIDGRNRYLMPGLADMHVHFYDTQGFASYLAHGVTAVANLNGSPPVLDWRTRTRQGSLLGPTIYTSGPSVNGYPGGNPLFEVAQSADDARRIVRAQAAAGYDFIKVYTFLEPDVYAALADEAAKVGIPILGHIPIPVQLEAVLAAGQVNIAHVEEFFQTGDIEDAKLSEVAMAVRDARTTVTPNLSAYADYLRSIADLPGVLRHPEMRFASPAAYSEKLPSNNRSVRPNPAEFAQFLSNRLERFRILTRHLQEAGVPLLLGTDTEIFGFAGHSAHEELAELVRAGLSPYQALRAATANAGELVARMEIDEEQFGTIAPGKRADLLLIDQNPLEDVGRVNGLQGVAVRGRWISAQELDRVRDSVAVAEGDAKQRVALVDSLIARGDGRAAAAELAELRKSHPAITPVAELVLRNYARRVFDSDLAGSLELRRFAVDLYPQSFSAQNELANGYLYSGDTTRAREHFASALALSPENFTLRDVVAKLGAVGTPASFSPAGSYAFETVTMRLANGPTPVSLTLEVTGSSAKYRGRILRPDQEPLAVEELVIGGSRIWAGLPFEGNYLELRLTASNDSLAGTWVLGFLNNGSIRGRRLR